MKNDNWNLPAPPGFRGLDPTSPVRAYDRHLPHWRQEGASYFVTFRLADSLPQSQRRSLQRYREEWEWRHPEPRTTEQADDLSRQLFTRLERFLDRGYGECCLRDPRIRRHVTDSLAHFDDLRYVLGCFVTMPNHVHVVVRPTDVPQYELEDILHSWKRHTASQINLALERSGTLWQEESFDRILRDEEHLYRCIQYIGRNPVRARLSSEEYSLWIRPEWAELGWRFEESSGDVDVRVGNPSYGEGGAA